MDVGGWSIGGIYKDFIRKPDGWACFSFRMTGLMVAVFYRSILDIHRILYGEGVVLKAASNFR
jgi:hypothetical protein